MTMKRRRITSITAGAALLLLGAGLQPAFADETNPPPPASAPQPGDPTTQVIPFSAPESFSDALTSAAA